MIKGRENIFKKLAKVFSENSAPIVWFHCASLGEFEQGRTVIETFKKQFPKFKILLTFFSPSGYEIRKNYAHADYIYYLPFDNQANASKFISIIKPKLAIFVKYEFWKNYLEILKTNAIPTYLISANFRPDQLFFNKNISFYKQILFNFDHIFTQNEESEKLLQSIGYYNITITGDTRFDRVIELQEQNKSLPEIEKFKGNVKLFVMGSAWAEDVSFLLPFINSENVHLKIIIAPHEIDAIKIEKWRNSFNHKSTIYSEITNNFDSKILIINNIGLLSSIYKYADFVWIGGAFGKGLHNILEAATFGKPIFFGNKNYIKFKEAVDLVENEGAFSFENYKEFQLKFDELNNNSNYYQLCSGKSKKYVEMNIGATKKIMNFIKINFKTALI